jgi:hypothetical protein
MDRERLQKLLRAVGKKRLVLDLSCRKKVSGTMICRTCKNGACDQLSAGKKKVITTTQEMDFVGMGSI